jgi:TonB-dependent Receptor Plug Domain
MFSPTRWILCAAAAGALAGCGVLTREPQAEEPAPLEEPQPRDAGSSQAVVVGERDLNGRNADLVNVLRNHVAGMQVDNSGSCRTVVMRGRRSLLGDNTPLVYVDGQRTGDACVLGMLNPGDVARVEIYPQGVPRAPYPSNANGVILVFMRTAGR